MYRSCKFNVQRDARPLLQFPSDAGQRWRGSDGVQPWVSRRRTGGQRKEEEEEGGRRGYGKGAGTGGREGVSDSAQGQRRWTPAARRQRRRGRKKKKEKGLGALTRPSDSLGQKLARQREAVLSFPLPLLPSSPCSVKTKPPAGLSAPLTVHCPLSTPQLSTDAGRLNEPRLRQPRTDGRWVQQRRDTGCVVRRN